MLPARRFFLSYFLFASFIKVLVSTTVFYAAVYMELQFCGNQLLLVRTLPEYTTNYLEKALIYTCDY